MILTDALRTTAAKSSRGLYAAVLRRRRKPVYTHVTRVTCNAPTSHHMSCMYTYTAVKGNVGQVGKCHMAGVFSSQVVYEGSLRRLSLSYPQNKALLLKRRVENRMCVAPLV
jgi:hypothetical protein